MNSTPAADGRMPVFQLSTTPTFPPPYLAERNGLLAVGGDLSRARLLQAYRNGIFPWYSENEPILWWSPDPRMVLYPGELRISRSLRKIVRQKRFQVSIDRSFEQVITACADIRHPGREGTWITPEMIAAYIDLHRGGYAHSIEAWQNGTLAGGLYGIALGRAFFGESMFTRISNASKVALIHLVRFLIANEFTFIDCQMTTAHLMRLGAREIPRSRFLGELRHALKASGSHGVWRRTPFRGPIRS